MASGSVFSNFADDTCGCLEGRGSAQERCPEQSGTVVRMKLQLTPCTFQYTHGGVTAMNSDRRMCKPRNYK